MSNKTWDEPNPDHGSCKRLLIFIKQTRLCYIVLLVGAIIYSRNAYYEYKLETTNFSEKNELLSIKDMPTLAMCLFFKHVENDLIYGKDLSIIAEVSGTQTKKVILIEGQEVEFLYDLKIYLSKLMIRQKFKYGSLHSIYHEYPSHHCYKVNSTSGVDSRWESIDLGNFDMNFTFQYSKITEVEERSVVPTDNGKWKVVNEYLNKTLVPDMVKIWITSEENSFGLVSGKWYDGFVQSPISFPPTSPLGNKVLRLGFVVAKQ